jgi:hypothetical protein
VFLHPQVVVSLHEFPLKSLWRQYYACDRER